MTAGPLKRIKHRAGWVITTLLALPLFWWVWLPGREPALSVIKGAVPRYVLSGKLFTDRFDTTHAGFAMDQPTIGKWLFWFSVMSVTSLPALALIGWFADRKKRSVRLVYSLASFVLGFILLCILSWPLLWLIQYVGSMGFTPRRIFGLCYCATGGLVVLVFMAWAARKPKSNEAQPPAPDVLSPSRE